MFSDFRRDGPSFHHNVCCPIVLENELYILICHASYEILKEKVKQLFMDKDIKV